MTLPAYDPATLAGAIVTSLATPTYHVHQAEVEVDTETGLVRVVGYHVVQDVGRAIDPEAIAGQVQAASPRGSATRSSRSSGSSMGSSSRRPSKSA